MVLSISGINYSIYLKNFSGSLTLQVFIKLEIMGTAITLYIFHWRDKQKTKFYTLVISISGTVEQVIILSLCLVPIGRGREYHSDIEN